MQPPARVWTRLAGPAIHALCIACAACDVSATAASGQDGATAEGSVGVVAPPDDGGGGSPGDGGAGDAGPAVEGAVDASTAVDGGDGGAVVGIATSPLPLVPAFSPSITDYYVRCASGDNAVTLTVTDADGPHESDLVLAEDQEVSVRGQYWIRCLPHDFPVITVTTHPDAGAPTPGWYLVNGLTYGAALDTNGTPVWYARGVAPGNVDAPAAGTISLQPNMQGPFGYLAANEFTLTALATSTVTTVMAVGTPTDGHEFRLLPNGDYLVVTYPIETGVDLTGLSSYGSNETMADCEIQEIAPSGDLVWSWLASDHIDPVLESAAPQTSTVNGTSVVDVFHLNSIDVDATGNLLVSARHTNALFYVDRPTGQVLWKIGGTSYSKDGADWIQVVGDPETAFYLQHDARFLPNGDISLFDDHGVASGVARAVEYTVDFDAETATVAFEFLGTAQSKYEGSFRRYADGESVIGWGYIPTDARVMTEINAAGQDVLDISLGGQASYRAVKVPISELDIGLLRATTAQ